MNANNYKFNAICNSESFDNITKINIGIMVFNIYE